MAKKPTNSTNIAACKNNDFFWFSLKKKGSYTCLEVRDTLELSLVVVAGFCVEFFSSGLCFGLFFVFGLFFYVVLVVVVEYFPLLCVGYLFDFWILE
jgi:hypothetical protein